VVWKNRFQNASSTSGNLKIIWSPEEEVRPAQVRLGWARQDYVWLGKDMLDWLGFVKFSKIK
jgi:hypothetical protein